ncbi:allergen Fel d 4-like isoform 3-T3 [Glossophaga mutica]
MEWEGKGGALWTDIWAQRNIKMKLLLLCLGLTLVCAHHEDNHDIVRGNIDLPKLSGEWYTVLMASELKEKIEENGSFRLFLESIQASDNSSMIVKCHHKVNGECAEHTFVCDETEVKGVYGVAYEGYNRLQITEAVYNEYIIIYNLNFNNEKITQLMKVDARTPDVSPQVKKRFEEFCQRHGIPKENVLDLTNADRCLQARGSN